MAAVPAGTWLPDFLAPTPYLVSRALALIVVCGLAATGLGVVAQLATEVRRSGS